MELYYKIIMTFILTQSLTLIIYLSKEPITRFLKIIEILKLLTS